MTIYLSQLRLDPMSRLVQTELRDPYQMHRTLCHAFPGLSKDEWREARVLFRVDEDAHSSLALLVQSKVAPDWNAFQEHLNGRHYGHGEVRSKAWEPGFREGQRLRFRLLANPTMASASERGPKRDRGARRGLFREAERLDWLRAQSERHGFALPLSEQTLHASDAEPIVFRGRDVRQDLTLKLPLVEMRDLNDGRRFPLREREGSDTKASGTKAQFSAALFEGQLQVTDPGAFAQAVESGIGKARGFGFGLLSVAPAKA